MKKKVSKYITMNLCVQVEHNSQNTKKKKKKRTTTFLGAHFIGLAKKARLGFSIKMLMENICKTKIN